MLLQPPYKPPLNTSRIHLFLPCPLGTFKFAIPVFNGEPHRTLNCPPAPPQTILTPFVAVFTILVGTSISPLGFSVVCGPCPTCQTSPYPQLQADPSFAIATL